MTHIITNLLFSIIEIVFVVYVLQILQDSKVRKQDFIFCIFMYMLGYFFIKDTTWNTYIVKNVYFLFVFIFYLFKYNMQVWKYIFLVCSLLSVCEFFEIIAAVMGSLSMLFLAVDILIDEKVAGMLSVIYMGLFIWSFVWVTRNRVINLEVHSSRRWIACFIYVITVCMKIPFLYTEIQYGFVWKLIFLTIICCTVIFFIISKIEKHNADQERAIIEENNKILSTKLHKAQEILPAMVQAVTDVVENNGREMEGQQAQKLLEEMTNMYGQNLKENSKEDLQLKNFCSTGLTLLDQQLKGYQIEASDKNVNLDIFVQAPINEIMKKDGIDQWKLQRAVGDMVRNAFRAEEREDKKCRTNKHILLIIGCRYEDVLEISVLDNGKPFPLHVIETFGKRGVTTGGTGNGLADLVEFADETNASICVEEFAWETSSFTKRVSIIFDCRRLNFFNSSREAFIKNAFWNKTE